MNVIMTEFGRDVDQLNVYLLGQNIWIGKKWDFSESNKEINFRKSPKNEPDRFDYLRRYTANKASD